MQKNTQGFSIIEIILAISLFAIVSLGALASALYGENAQIGSGDRKRATLLADQTIEIIRAVRDSASEGFAALGDGTYGLAQDWNGTWILVPDEPDSVDTFLRTVTINSVSMVLKQIDTNICWPSDNCAGSVNLTTYLTDWRTDILGTPGGIRVATSGDGYAYMITTNNTLEVYDVSAPDSPVKVGALTLAGSAGTLPTSLFYANGRVYITSENTVAELQIVDVSSPEDPTALGTLNLAVDGDDVATGDSVWADGSGHVFAIARNSDSTVSQFFMIDASDGGNPSVILDGEMYTTSDAQTPGGITVGQISATDTMCTTAGGSTDEGYVLHCYTFDFSIAPYDTPPSYSETVSELGPGFPPSRTVAIVDGSRITTPGGTITVNGSDPITISENNIYDLSVVTRSGRLYAYASVIGDTTSGLKEIDITDENDPIIITARNTDGTFSGVVYDDSTTPEYIFGANRTGGTLGFLAFAPTPVGIAVSPIDNIVATTTEGASLVHCDPIVDADTDHGCPITYTLENVTGSSIDYDITVSEPWVTISNAGGTLSGGSTDTVDVSIDVDTVISEELDEGVHTATLHITYDNGDPADITRTITLTVLPATGIKVKAQ